MGGLAPAGRLGSVGPPRVVRRAARGSPPVGCGAWYPPTRQDVRGAQAGQRRVPGRVTRSVLFAASSGCVRLVEEGREVAGGWGGRGAVICSRDGKGRALWAAMAVAATAAVAVVAVETRCAPSANPPESHRRGLRPYHTDRTDARVCCALLRYCCPVMVDVLPLVDPLLPRPPPLLRSPSALRPPFTLPHAYSVSLPPRVCFAAPPSPSASPLADMCTCTTLRGSAGGASTGT